MTVQEYQSRNAAISSEIENITSQAASLDVEASGFEQTAQQWTLNKTNPCKGTAKQKAACENDNVYKDGKAAEYKSYAKARRDSAQSLRNRIPGLQAEFNNNLQLMKEAQASATQVSKTLSEQGLTLEAVQTTAKAQAEGITTTAMAQAKGIEEKAAADASNKKKYGMVAVAIALVVVAIVGFVLYKKFKKK